jgi:GAF domain-containing protein
MRKIGTRDPDVEIVVEASQALSSEIVLPKLIEKFMRIAIEHAGAERGLLILLRDDEPEIEAEAASGRGEVKVTVRPAAVTPLDLPKSVLQYVIRTRERVVLGDASVGNMYSLAIRWRRSRRLLVRARPLRNRLCNAGVSACGRLPMNQQMSRCRFCRMVCAPGSSNM